MYDVVSHEVPEHPVVSPTSGNIFERNLIVKYIEDNGVDPINGEALTVGQLIPLKGSEIYKLLVLLMQCSDSQSTCQAQATISN